MSISSRFKQVCFGIFDIPLLLCNPRIAPFTGAGLDVENDVQVALWWLPGQVTGYPWLR